MLAWFADPMSRLALPILLTWLVLLAVGFRTRAAEPPKVFLEIDGRIEGRGSWPDQDAKPSSQSWVLKRTYRGYVEVTVRTATIETPGGPRTVFNIRPRTGGISTLVVTQDDMALNQLTEMGEGGSTMEYTAREEWTSRVNLEARELGSTLTLDLTNRVWGGAIGFSEAESRLAERVQYRGVARMLPGQGGGFADPWEFFTTDPRSQQVDGQGVSTRYHPGSPATSGFNVAERPVLASVGAFAGEVEVEVPRLPGAPGEWQMRGSLRWTLRQQVPEVLLEVFALGYRDWRPTLAPDLGPGAPLVLAAGIVSPKKEPLDGIRVRRFTWNLNETSREPGVAMNFPARERADTRPDLQLQGIPTSDDGQRAEEFPEPGRLASLVEVAPYDWGAGRPCAWKRSWRMGGCCRAS